MRILLLGICQILLRVFFRRIEVVGGENLPERDPVLFILNHPNGLLDPLFVLCLSGRPVSFLAKEPLFRTFLVRHFVKAFRCLPVYRRSDGADPAQNRRVIEQAVSLLESGNAIAIFPEGTSHSGPELLPLKPGAARMALSASSTLRGAARPVPVKIVPIGLFYSRKTRFRSTALMTLGPAIETKPVTLDESFNPPKDAVRALTEELSRALAGVTLQAESMEAMELAQSVERLLRATQGDEHTLDSSEARRLSQRRELRQRIIDGYAALRRSHPNEVAEVRARLHDYEARLTTAGLRPEQRVVFSVADIVRASLGSLLTVFTLLPLGAVGFAVNYPAYKIVGRLAFHMAKGEEDIIATLKAVWGLMLFPLTWLLLALALGWQYGWPQALVSLGALPVCSYAALLLLERATHAVTQSYVVGLLLLKPRLRSWIVRERQVIRDQISLLETLLTPSLQATQSPNTQV